MIRPLNVEKFLAMPTALALMLHLFDQLVNWARARFCVTFHEYGPIPEFRVMLWAKETYSDPREDHELFVFKLPSYEWTHIDYGRRWGWCQRHLVRRGRRWMNGEVMRAEWRIYLVPVRDLTLS